jgi:hypothetical protein
MPMSKSIRCRVTSKSGLFDVKEEDRRNPFDERGENGYD